VRYFFFRTYELNIRQRAAIPWLRPLALVSLLTGLNAFALLLISYELWGGAPALDQRKVFFRVVVFSWIVVMFVLLYFRWIKSGRYLRFKDEFPSESSVQRKFRALLLIIYGIVSLFGPAALSYWSYLRRAGMLIADPNVSTL
jgi:hypothetical protein